MTMLETIGPNDWTTIAPHISALLDVDLTPERATEWLWQWSDLAKSVWDGLAALNRAKFQDTTNEAAEQAFHTYLREIESKFSVANQALRSKLLSVPDYVPAPAHAEMVRRWRNEVDLFRPENVALQTDITALESEFYKIAWAPPTPTGDQESTSPSTNQESRDAPRAVPQEIRREAEAAWRAETARWMQHRDLLNDVFLQLLALRRQLARNAGLPTYRAYEWRALNRLDYTPTDALAFHDAVAREIVPLVTRWRDAQRAQLRARTSRPWDFEVDLTPRSPVPPYADVHELVAGVERLLGQVDPEFGALFARLRAGDLDVGRRPGKAPTSVEIFCYKTGLPYVHVTEAPPHELGILLHETGHAFHDMISAAHQDLFWNVGGPEEFCECAAATMMLLPMAYLERQHGGFYAPEDVVREQVAAVERMMVHYQPHLTAVDAFEHWVYGEAPEDVRPRDLDAKWRELSGRFMPTIDWTGLEAEQMSRWQREWTTFSRPFYMNSYSLAHFGALQIWRNAQADPRGTVRAFKEALALGKTRPLPELYKVAGVRLPFTRTVVGDVARFIAPYLSAPV